MREQTMARREETTTPKGFTLLEVLIAMSILAVGAASILSIFVWAIAFHTKRVEANRLAGVYNHALSPRPVNSSTPGSVPKGESLSRGDHRRPAGSGAGGHPDR
jgi:prepilin-type N-terminal cleavage/methylation domain-containing protein